MIQPILMPFQDLSFNGDVFANKEFLVLKKKYKVKNVIETGSCFYSTTEWLSENFDKVFTCEINNEFAKYGYHKVAEKENVIALIDDSVSFINKLEIAENERCLYFLDAHWGEVCPLLDELDAICKKTTTKPPVIVIHDFYTGNEELGYDSYNGQPFTYDWIQPHIKKIEESLACEYTYYFNDEAVGAKRGIIYLTPKM
jgi:hypothetical protein